MAKLAIKKASTDVTVYLFIQASNVTTGAGLTGLVYNTTDLVASYVRPLGTRTALTLATLAAADSAHSDGGFKEVDATNMPGIYRLDLPDAVCATGVPSVVVMLKGATNMSPVVLEIQLTDFDLNDASPNVTVADIATDAITAASLKADAVTEIQNGLATPTNITAGTITTVTNLTNLPAITTNWLTAAGIAADAVTELQAGLALEATLTAIKGAGWTTETLVTLKAYVDEIETRLTATRAGYLDKLNVTGTLAHSDAAAAYKADVSGLAPANEYDAQLSAIQADLDNPAQYRADVSGLATQESVNAIPTTPLLAANYTAPDNAGIEAIKTKTDQLTFTTLNKVDASATIDPTGIATSEELEIIGEKVDNVLDKLNVSSVEFVTSVVGSTITILRGDTLTASLLNLGSMESYVSLDFTVKASMHQSDDDAVIRVRKNASGLTDGLLRLNGAAHTTGTDGSITINDAPTGDITIMLKAGVTDDLVPGTYVYDIQLIEAAEVTTLTTGSLIVSADVTRLVA